MSDFPPSGQVIGPVISTMSIWAFGGTAIGLSIAAPASRTWPSANGAIYIPFTLPCPFLVKAGYVRNGLAVSGNFDIGVLGLDGSLIVHSGSTAQAGTSTLQFVTLTETLLSPGSYYMALSVDNTTATISAWAYTGGKRMGGILEAASQFPLATLPTFASSSNDYQPNIGIATVATF